MALLDLGSIGKYAVLEHISQGLHNGTDADLSRINNVATMFVAFSLSLYPVRPGEDALAHHASAHYPTVAGGGAMDEVRACLVKLGVGAFLNMCRVMTAGYLGSNATSENRVLPDGATAISKEGHRYLKSAARVPGTYLLDPTESKLNMPPLIAKAEALRAIKMQSLLRCRGFLQVQRAINQFNRDGARNVHSSGSDELDIGAGARSSLRTTSTANYAGKGGSGDMSDDRKSAETTMRWNTFVAAAARVAGKERRKLTPAKDSENADNLFRYAGPRNVGYGVTVPAYEHRWASRLLPVVRLPGDNMPIAAWLAWEQNP